MTATIRYACDGHRHGQPCRGALPTRTNRLPLADDTAITAGWRELHLNGTWLDLCPSRGHDEDDET